MQEAPANEHRLQRAGHAEHAPLQDMPTTIPQQSLQLWGALLTKAWQQLYTCMPNALLCSLLINCLVIYYAQGTSPCSQLMHVQ